MKDVYLDKSAVISQVDHIQATNQMQLVCAKKGSIKSLLQQRSSI